MIGCAATVILFGFAIWTGWAERPIWHVIPSTVAASALFMAAHPGTYGLLRRAGQEGRATATALRLLIWNTCLYGVLSLIAYGLTRAIKLAL